MFNNKIKKIIGQELHKYRCDRFLQLKTVATKTGIPWYVIDNMEIGSVRKWEYYRHLLEFYGKELKIELIERNGRIGNGTVKNGGGNDRQCGSVHQKDYLRELKKLLFPYIPLLSIVHTSILYQHGLSLSIFYVHFVLSR